MVEAQRRVALLYFEDGSVEQACPPVKALLHIMAHGHYQGKRIESATVRGMFQREALLGSDWYQERLRVKQRSDVRAVAASCGGARGGAREHRMRRGDAAGTGFAAGGGPGGVGPREIGGISGESGGDARSGSDVATEGAAGFPTPL